MLDGALQPLPTANARRQPVRQANWSVFWRSQSINQIYLRQKRTQCNTKNKAKQSADHNRTIGS